MNATRLDEMHRLLGQQDAYIVILKQIRIAVHSERISAEAAAALNAIGDVAYRGSVEANERVAGIAAEVQTDIAIERAAA